MKTQSTSGSRGRAGVRISNLPPWLSLLCMVIYIKEEPAMQISVSSTLTVYHDGQFWVGLAEHVEDGRYGAARIVFGAEPSDAQGALARSRFRQTCKKKASELEGSEAVIPVISLMALLYGDAETASGGTRRYQNASSEASSRYSHRHKRICSRLPIDALPRARQTPHRGTPAHGRRGAANEAARKTRDSPNR